MGLFIQLWKISKSIRLDIGKLYGNVLIEKVNHGLHMLEIMSELPVTTRVDKGPLLRKEITKSYEALKSYTGQISEWTIYKQRFIVLNDEERLKYRIKLMKKLPNLSEKDGQKMYQLL